LATTKHIHIGCQSWSYEDWVTPPAGETVFYPHGTRQAEMLPLYARVFETIEVDSTAYGVPRQATVAGWYEKTPENFRFSLKTPRVVTHELSLRAESFPVVDEFAEAASLLGKKLAMVLVQLPAAFEPTKENGAALREFIARLPKKGNFAVEFRHEGWFVDWTFQELEQAGVSLALVEGKWVDNEVMFRSAGAAGENAYIRIMGERDLAHFDRIYRDRQRTLEQWAALIERLRAKEVFVYIDNYFEGHAPATANKLKKLLGLPVVAPESIEDQPSLF
jgi:uncharacterized protein YecE (DUF72 family)